MKRHVVNTTCLELAKPSSQQFRLTCSQYNYHCLLDETFTKEFEVCREWKWIPRGQCAYFNTYGEGNIDGRHCVNSENLVCPTRQYSSAQTTKYTACYVKKITSTIEPRTRMLHVTSTETSDGGISTNWPNSEINDKQLKKLIWALPIVFAIVLAVMLFATVSFFYFGGLKRLRKVKSDTKEDEEKSVAAIDDLQRTPNTTEEKDIKKYIGIHDSNKIPRNDDPEEQNPLLRNNMDNSFKMSSVNEHNVNGPRKKGNGIEKSLYKDDGRDEGNEYKITQSVSNLSTDSEEGDYVDAVEKQKE